MIVCTFINPDSIISEEKYHHKSVISDIKMLTVDGVWKINHGYIFILSFVIFQIFLTDLCGLYNEKANFFLPSQLTCPPSIRCASSITFSINRNYRNGVWGIWLQIPKNGVIGIPRDWYLKILINIKHWI